MTGQLLQKNTLANKTSYYFLLCFVILLPFKIIYSELALAGFAAVTVLLAKKEQWRNILNRQVLIMAGLYVLGIIGMLYSPDVKEALNVSGRQLAMLLFPVLFAVNPLDMSSCRTVLLKAFATSCTAALLYLYIAAFYTMGTKNMAIQHLFSQDFMNHNFSLPLGIHATYLSGYAAFSVIILLYCFQQNNGVGRRWLYGTGIFVLLAGIVQLSSRAPVIALLVVVFLCFPFFMMQQKKRTWFVIGAALVSAAILFSIYNSSSFKTRYVGELKNDLGIDTLNTEFTEPRVIRWQAELELIQKSPVWGYGSGSEKELLHQKFTARQLHIAATNYFNSHNQYLSFLLNMGIPGLAAYLFVLLYGCRLAWKQRSIPFAGFMVIIIILSFSENILFVNKGIFFYSFFLALFFLPVKTTPALTHNLL